MFSKKVIDNRKKNTVRKISNSTKKIVFERDGGRCIICNCSTMDEFHHIYFGGSAIYTENRNDPDQIVLLCHSCHNHLHFFGERDNLRQDCIDYITNYYLGK